MLHTIKKVDYISEYKLRLYFNNRKIKIVDLEKVVKKGKNMFLPLLAVDYFKLVKCDGTTIYWPNGVDLCPDVLYGMGESIASKPKKVKRPSIKTKARRRVKSSL